MNKIYSEVKELLEDKSGQVWVDRITQLLTDMNAVSKEIIAFKKRINPRRQIMFYVAPGDARNESKLDLSVRLSGWEIGRVVLDRNKSQRLFEKNISTNSVIIKDTWSKHFGDQKDILWEEPSVAKYIAELAELVNVAVLKPESYVEDGMIKALKVGRGEVKLPEFICCQPILFPYTKRYSGFPFQFPVPISGNKKDGLHLPRSKGSGHIDILGIRTRGGRYEIEIFELKKAASGKTKEALKQGVAYAASPLHYMIRTRKDFLKEFRTLFGKATVDQNTTIRVTAVVSSHDSNLEAYERFLNEIDELSPFKISALFYDLNVNSGFKIVRSKDRPITKRRRSNVR